MKYAYNFSFLSEWLEANPEIPKGEILQALGAKSNNRFKAWVRCEGPMPIISMLRLCNAFQIPLSAFFRDAEADADGAVVPAMPTANDILEPAQGYASSSDERQHGERSILNPMDVRIIPSVVPGMVTKPREKDNPQKSEIPVDNTIEEKGATPKTNDNVSYANLAAIVELENRHLEQQRQLLNVITEQQKQIAYLTRMLNETKRYNNIKLDEGYMVADHPTEE